MSLFLFLFFPPCWGRLDGGPRGSGRPAGCWPAGPLFFLLTAAFYACARARAQNLRYRARASTQVKHHAVQQSPAGQQASRAGRHQGPQLRMVDVEGGEGGGGRERGEGGRGSGGSQLPLYLSMLFLRPACAAILRVFVRSVSMFLFCVSVAFSSSLHRPLSSRFHLLLVAFPCALVSRPGPFLHLRL
jgi:hypothetical protein